MSLDFGIAVIVRKVPVRDDSMLQISLLQFGESGGGEVRERAPRDRVRSLVDRVKQVGQKVYTQEEPRWTTG